jgi:pyridoxal phosphate enzyme (YggS family)
MTRPTVETADPPLPVPEPDPGAQARLAQCLQSVRGRMRAAEAAAGRPPGSVQLLAVSKTFGAGTIAAAARLGQRLFGENYAQEAIGKMESLRAHADLPALEWHFIGPIQSNKTRLIATHFQWVQSVERFAIARRLSEQRPPDLPALQVLIEVNISGEASKSGVAPEHLRELAGQINALPRLNLRGLMAIPAPGLSVQGQRAAFARLRALLDELRGSLRADASSGTPDSFPGSALGSVPGSAPGSVPGSAPGFVPDSAPGSVPDSAPNSAPDAAPESALESAGDTRLDTLSMGMSADFESAIAEGASLVRIGSAIFGERA